MLVGQRDGALDFGQAGIAPDPGHVVIEGLQLLLLGRGLGHTGFQRIATRLQLLLEVAQLADLFLQAGSPAFGFLQAQGILALLCQETLLHVPPARSSHDHDQHGHGQPAPAAPLHIDSLRLVTA